MTLWMQVFERPKAIPQQSCCDPESLANVQRVHIGDNCKGDQLTYYSPLFVRADLGGHLKYSRRWSGVRAGVLLGAQGAVRRGENRGRL